LAGNQYDDVLSGMCTAVCGCIFLYCIFAGANLVVGLVRCFVVEVDLVDGLVCCIVVEVDLAVWWAKVVAGLVVWS
jgi:hypothetical protein